MAKMAEKGAFTLKMEPKMTYWWRNWWIFTGIRAAERSRASWRVVGALKGSSVVGWWSRGAWWTPRPMSSSSGSPISIGRVPEAGRCCQREGPCPRDVETGPRPLFWRARVPRLTAVMLNAAGAVKVNGRGWSVNLNKYG